jgi:hypothetical protein
MRMNSRRWEWRLAAFALLVWLVFVSNPELRVLLILVDSLGLELVLLLLAIQLRVLLPMVRAVAVAVCARSCLIAFLILRIVLRAFAVLMPRRAAPGTSMLLYVLSKNLWCPISKGRYGYPTT